MTKEINSEHIMFKVPVTMFEKLHLKAKKENISMSKIIRDALTKIL